MTDERKISLCIPTYNRVELLIESFEKVYNDERVLEIVISDDCSDKEYYCKVDKMLSGLPKIKLFRNNYNIDCYRNKKTAIELATNEWCILLDSDNVITSDYLDKLYAVKHWNDNTIYTPDFAEPNFNFQNFSGLLISRCNVASYITAPMFETMLNACNFLVNREEYLKAWDGSVDPVTSDSIYFCLKWLQNFNFIKVVTGLTYFHRVHNGSHYQNERHRTPEGFHESILSNLREML